ncbi:hypothetical protein PENSPDRAFT_574831 [Peniophora sp. CONT]|nr:hypothetical protein PENSPDRAFT_574831 [Peniophora sp. CONT]
MRTALIRLWASSLYDRAHVQPFSDESTDSGKAASTWLGAIPSHLLDYHSLEVDELSALVAHTKGFYARDYSLWLGWNNMRYIIDTAFLQARLLNRTLLLPSFVYARGCFEGSEACADCLSTDHKCRELPFEQYRHIGYRIPIQLMLNITTMRTVHPTILVSDYLRMHGLPTVIENKEGLWERAAYHSMGPLEGDRLGPDLFVIQKGWYDTKEARRVDGLTEGMKSRGHWISGNATEVGASGRWEEKEDSEVARKLRFQFGLFNTLPWDNAVKTLRKTSAAEMYDLSSEAGVLDALHDHGWEVVHTFEGMRRSDLAKAVVEPIREVVERNTLRGFVDDFANVEARVLLLEGDLHNERKAGAMRFTTASGLEQFQRDVLYSIQPIQLLQELAERLAERMYERTGGRLWAGAHMRRGDFVNLNWAASRSHEGHMRMVKSRLLDARHLIESIQGNVQPYPVPNASIDPALLARPPPVYGDPFYLATDERDSAARAHFRDQGAILLPDILRQEDLDAVGWPLLLSDIRVVVEQELLARAAYFTGTHMSSVAGGVLNMRAAHGADRRAASLY